MSARVFAVHCLKKAKNYVNPPCFALIFDKWLENGNNAPVPTSGAVLATSFHASYNPAPVVPPVTPPTPPVPPKPPVDPSAGAGTTGGIEDPGNNGTKPGNKPGDNGGKPGDNGNKPGDNGNKPGANRPGDNGNKPRNKPSDNANNPVDNAAKPGGGVQDSAGADTQGVGALTPGGLGLKGDHWAVVNLGMSAASVCFAVIMAVAKRRKEDEDGTVKIRYRRYYGTRRDYRVSLGHSLHYSD